MRKAKGPDGEPEEVKELSAKGIDEMLEALELVNQKTDKATVGSKVKSRFVRDDKLGLETDENE